MQAAICHSRLVFLILLLAALGAAVPRTHAQASPASSSLFSVDDMLDVTNIGPSDLSEDGHWLALATASLRDRIGVDNYRFGDPTYIAPQLARVWVIDTRNAATREVFADKRQVRALHWSPDGKHLAMLVLNGQVYEPAIWDGSRVANVPLPPGKYVAETGDLAWTRDSSALLIPLRSLEWRQKEKDRFAYETRGPVVVHSSKEPFLAWDDVRRMPLVRTLAAYDLKTGGFREIVPEKKISSYSVGEDGSFITYSEDITQKTDYDYIFGTDDQVRVASLTGVEVSGEARTIIKSTRGLDLIWSRDGRHYAYSKEGKVFYASIDDKQPRQIAGEVEQPAAKMEDKPKADSLSEAEKKKKEKDRFKAVRLDPKGAKLVAANNEGLWLIDTSNSAKELFLKMPEDDKQAPRYEVVDWSADGENIFLSYSSRTGWERGFVRYNIRTKALSELLKDWRLYSGFRLSRNGATAVFASGEGNHPLDLYAADADLKAVRRLTDLNPQLKQKSLGKTQLVSYLDADGNKLHGVLYLPADHEPGKKYPTVFSLYEDFFDDGFNPTISVLNANGFAVMQPSVTLETGFPGEAWLKGVTAAANKLIEMGIADPDRLGIMGVSYGGYAVNLLVTQTNRFKAAINISGKVDMVSFYTDSPKLGVRNIHAPEKSQDRLGATLWQQPQKYIQHSAIMFADRIKTPLMLVTGEQDPNVPARQAMEMYYALRRLGKEVEWVSYTNGGHGMPTSTVDEVKDYHARIIQWLNEHLKGDLKKDVDADKQQ